MPNAGERQPRCMTVNIKNKKNEGLVSFSCPKTNYTCTTIDTMDDDKKMIKLVSY